MSAGAYHRLVTAYRETPGHEIYWQIQSIGISMAILHRNEAELVTKLRDHATFDSLRQFDQSNRQGMQAEFHEIIRLIHNYVASIKSLVDHTRRISRKILSETGQSIYQQEIDSQFTNDDLTSFLHDLRNYLLHVTHPPVKKTVRFDSGTIAVELDTQQLLESDQWRAASKRFLMKYPKSVVLEPLICDYSEKVTNFHNWLTAHIESDRKGEMDDFWQKHHAWADWCREQGIPITDEEMKSFMERDKDG